MSFEKFDNFINTALTSDNKQLPQKKAQNIADSPIATPTPTPTAQTSSLKDEFVVQKAKNGIVERIYDSLKNLTNIGLGSKKVENDIAAFEEGKLTKDAVDGKIEKYKASQKNAEQFFGDAIAAGATFGTFFAGKNLLNKFRAMTKLNAYPIYLTPFLDYFKKHNFAEKLKSNPKFIAMSLIPLALIGGITKYFTLKFNRMGSQEFKADKNLKQTDKEKYREEKKQLRKARISANANNFVTGALGGLITPIAAIGGGLIGVPAYMAGVLGIRHLRNKDKNKSFSDFTKNLTDNYLLSGLSIATITTLGIKKANFSHVLNKNLGKVVEKLKDAKFEKFALGESNYKKISKILLDSSSIKKILNPNVKKLLTEGKLDQKTLDKIEELTSVEHQIGALTKENIFAVKFLQTSGYESDLVKTLIENCPPSRSLKAAQKEINKLIGDSSKYKVEKLLGVGTIAETYLAKDSKGKEVCIKILKDGINAKKIAKDKEKFIKLASKSCKNAAERDYIIRCINDYANGIEKEVDLVNEMKAAQSLVKVTHKANVAVPIEAKSGIYVMEKAKGISVQTLRDYYACKAKMKIAKKIPIFSEEELKKEMKKIKSRAPEFKDFNPTTKQLKNILFNYIDLLVEQFSKINRGGKIIHADIHPGNVIIDLDVVTGKSKGKMFTLIDTGNVVNMTKQESLDMLNFTNYLRQGNIKNLTRSILDGAILPKGMTKEAAQQKFEEKLRKCFFDSKTGIENMTMDNFFRLSDTILADLKIIPNNTQLNLAKAKNAAGQSFGNLINCFFNEKIEKMDKKASAGAISQLLIDALMIGKKFTQSQKVQELFNLIKLSPSEMFQSAKNRPAQNGEDYLTYVLKQNLFYTQGIEKGIKKAEKSAKKMKKNM